MFLLFTIILFLTISIPSIMVNMKDYKSYKKVYDSLPERKFYLNDTQVYSYKFGQPDDGFVWFLDSNSFRLEHGSFLHNEIFTYFDPYSLYWLIKYKRCANKNISKLEKF